MIGYIPLEVQKKYARIRNICTWGIASIYIAAAAILVFFEEFKWWAVAAAVLLPPLISIILVSRADDDKSHLDQRKLVGTAGASLLILVGAGLVFGSDTVRLFIGGTVGTVVVIAAVYGLIRWIDNDRSPGGARLGILAVIAVAGALIAGAVYGPPLVSWMCIGTGAALLWSALGLPREYLQHAFEGGRHGWYGDSMALDPSEGRYSDPREPSYGRRDYRPHDLRTVLADARRAVDRLMWHDDDRPEYYGHIIQSESILLAVAALDNLGFISPEMAQEFAPVALRIQGRSESPPEEDERRSLRRLANQLTYGLSRLEAHELGARHRSLLKDG